MEQEEARHGRGFGGAWAPSRRRERPAAGRCAGRPFRQVRRSVQRLVRTHPGHGARWSARERKTVDPARGADVAQTTTVMSSEDTRWQTSEQRRRGNAATAESWNRACSVGETRRWMARPDHGHEDEDVRRARNPRHGRLVIRWRAVTLGRCADPARGRRVVRPRSRTPSSLDFTQTVARTAPSGSSARGGLRLPGTGTDATSGTFEAFWPQRWGRRTR